LALAIDDADGVVAKAFVDGLAGADGEEVDGEFGAGGVGFRVPGSGFRVPGSGVEAWAGRSGVRRIRERRRLRILRLVMLRGRGGYMPPPIP
jgi:hypothetical protein